MKTYFSDIIPRLYNFSKKLDTTTLITQNEWIIIDDASNSKIIYIFRKNNELLISNNGKVTKGTWDIVGQDSLLIDFHEGSYLFKLDFFDGKILALKLENLINEYAFLVSKTLFDSNIKSSPQVTEYLQKKYLKESSNDSENLILDEDFFLEAEVKVPQPLILPGYIEKFMSKDPLSNLIEKEYGIKFDDGIIGCYYKFHLLNKEFYFFYSQQGKGYKELYRYNSKESCINSLYSFKRNGVILDEGLFGIYKI